MTILFIGIGFWLLIGLALRVCSFLSVRGTEEIPPRKTLGPEPPFVFDEISYPAESDLYQEARMDKWLR
jgi:hypothetical protein